MPVPPRPAPPRDDGDFLSHRRLERRRVFGENVEPGDEPRMARAPGAFEPQIEIAQRRRQRDMADVDGASPRRVQPQAPPIAVDLALLQIDERLVTRRFRPRGGFITEQQSRVANPVAERLQAQRGETARGIGWEKSIPTGEMVEIFGDDAAVIERRTILQHQHRDFAEQILHADAIGGIGEIDAGDLDAVRRAPEYGRRCGFCGRRARRGNSGG